MEERNISIVAILNSADWAALEWTGDYDEDDENIEAVQSVRGFHTLEYLTFKDGEPRSVSAKTGSTDPNTLEYADANKDAWANYMQAVAALLRADANTLYKDWNESYNGGKMVPKALTVLSTASSRLSMVALISPVR